MKELKIIAIPDLPIFKKGDNVAQIILGASKNNGILIDRNDIVVIAQKIISKAEGALVNLEDITPSDEAKKLSEKTGRSPEICQVYIDQSIKILGTKGRMVITEHKIGFICTGAGVDSSNLANKDENIVSLLPKDPDRSAREIRDNIFQETGNRVAVIINDSFGKSDREGSYGIAIGIAGISALETQKKHDLFGNESNNKIALVDELAAAASILMGQSDEKQPVILIKGADFTVDEEADIRNILIPQ